MDIYDVLKKVIENGLTYFFGLLKRIHSKHTKYMFPLIYKIFVKYKVILKFQIVNKSVKEEGQMNRQYGLAIFIQCIKFILFSYWIQ